MAFVKCFLATFFIYLGLNFVFMLLFVLTGGWSGIDAGIFFEHASGDWAGFLTLIFQPGGVYGTFSNNIIGFGNGIISETANQFSTGANVMGLLWTFLPGMIAALIGGYKFTEGEIKIAFFATMFAIILATLVPMVLALAGLLDPALPGDIVPSGLIPAIIINKEYLAIVVSGFVNGGIFGGTAAIIAESNY